MNDYTLISILIICGAVLSCFSVFVGGFHIAILGAAILFLFAHWKIAELFADIAWQKGLDEENLTLFCFLTGIIGYMYVIALPDKSKEKDQTEVQN